MAGQEAWCWVEMCSSPSSSPSSSPRCSVCCWLGGGVHMLPAPLPTGDCLLSVLHTVLRSAAPHWPGPAPPQCRALVGGDHCPLCSASPASSIFTPGHCPLCPALPTSPSLPSSAQPAHVMRAARSWSQCGLRRAVPHTAFTIYSADCCVF